MRYFPNSLSVAGLLVCAALGLGVAAERGASAPGPDDKSIWWAPAFEYNHKQTEVLLSGKDGVQAWLEQGGARILANRISWNRRTKVGHCVERVRIVDLTNDTVITGNEAWHYSDASHSIVNGSPKMRMEKDDITVFADEMHRFGGETATAEARGSVRIVTKDGTAFGDLAVYDQKKGELALSGDPWLEQKTNTHRARKIVFYRNDNKVLLSGAARMMQGRDYIRADRILIVDLDQTNKKTGSSAASASSAPSVRLPVAGSAGTNRAAKERKNRIAYCNDDVRIYRHTKKGELESVTSGGYGEFFEKRGYVRLTGHPQMILVSDNTTTSGAVMEQYRDEDLAVIKGSAFINKGYRTVSAQLIRYDTKARIAEISGNPVIKEFEDSYRADHVYYNTSRDTISWLGSTMAVVGTAAQGKKETDWMSKNGGTVFALAAGANGGQIIRAVGDVWLSTSGRPVTNDKVVRWGKRADSADFVPQGTHVVIVDTWSWCDILGSDGLMLRLRGPAHLVLHAASWFSEEGAPAARSAGASSSPVVSGRPSSSASSASSSSAAFSAAGPRRSSAPSGSAASSASRAAGPAPQTSSSRSAPGSSASGSVPVARVASSSGSAVSAAALATASRPAAATRAASSAAGSGGVARTSTDGSAGRATTRRLGQTSWDLRQGVLLARPGKNAVLDITTATLVLTNIRVPVSVEILTQQVTRLVIHATQERLVARIRLGFMTNISFRSNSERLDLAAQAAPVLESVIKPRVPLLTQPEAVFSIDRVLVTLLSNERQTLVARLSNIAATNTNIAALTNRETLTLLTNKNLIEAGAIALWSESLRVLSAVAATNTPGRPVELPFAVTSRRNAAAGGAGMQARLFWQGETRKNVLDRLAGQVLFATCPMPKKETDFGELVDETGALSITYGRQQAGPSSRPATNRAPGGSKGRKP